METVGVVIEATQRCPRTGDVEGWSEPVHIPLVRAERYGRVWYGNNPRSELHLFGGKESKRRKAGRSLLVSVRDGWRNASKSNPYLLTLRFQEGVSEVPAKGQCRSETEVKRVRDHGLGRVRGNRVDGSGGGRMG